MTTSDDLLLGNDEQPDLMKERLSTWLSTAAILAIAVGAGWGLWRYIGPWSLCAGGVVLAALVGIVDASRTRAVAEPAAEPKPAPLPGPADPGSVHIGGTR